MNPADLKVYFQGKECIVSSYSIDYQQDYQPVYSLGSSSPVMVPGGSIVEISIRAFLDPSLPPAPVSHPTEKTKAQLDNILEET